MTFYKKCLQKHMFVFGSHKTYLSKGAGHTPKMQYLSTIFPESRFICTVRSPERVIPSAISLFVRFCEIYHTPYSLSDLTCRVISMADYWYPHPLEIFENLPERRFIILIYEKFSRDICKAVSSVYHRFGMELTKKFNDFLEAENGQTFISEHRYSAEKYGLTHPQIVSRYDYIYRALLKKETDGNQQKAVIPIPLVKD